MTHDPKMNRRDVLKAAGAAGASLALGPLANASISVPRPQKGKNMAGFAVPKMDRVRVGFIGVGARGSGHVAQMLLLDGVDVKAICDPHLPSARASEANVVKAGRPAPAMYTGGPKDYEKMVQRDDL